MLARTPQNSALLSLPPELRNYIWTLALNGNICDKVVSLSWLWSRRTLPPILQVSSQTRSESLPIWAARITVLARWLHHRGNYEIAIAWLNGPGQDCARHFREVMIGGIATVKTTSGERAQVDLSIRFVLEAGADTQQKLVIHSTPRNSKIPWQVALVKFMEDLMCRTYGQHCKPGDTGSLDTEGWLEVLKCFRGFIELEHRVPT